MSEKLREGLMSQTLLPSDRYSGSLNKYPELGLYVTALDRLLLEMPLEVDDQDALLVFALWVENPALEKRIARTFGITETTVKERVGKVIDGQGLENAWDLMDGIIGQLKESVHESQTLKSEPVGNFVELPVKRRRERNWSKNQGLERKNIITDITELREKGVSDVEISDVLGIPYTTVRSIVNYLLRKGKVMFAQVRRTASEVEDFRKQVEILRQEGLGNKQIASRLDVDYGLVRDAAHELILSGNILPRKGGKSTGPRAETRKFDAQVKRLVSQGLSNRDIAEKLKSSYIRVSSAISRLRQSEEIPAAKMTPEEIETLQSLVRLLEQQGLKKRYIVEEVLKELGFESESEINFSDIARLVGCTREYVRQIYDKLDNQYLQQPKT